MDWSAILGHAVSEPETAAALARLGEAPQESDDDDRRYLEFTASGLEMVIKKDKIATVFVYPGKAAPTLFPSGITTALTREEAIKNFGAPHEQGSPPLSWIKYRNPPFSLHLQFGDDGRVSLVTLAAL